MSINRSLHRIAQEGVIQTLEEKDKEIERLNNIIDKAENELFNLKDMIYKSETREINFDIQRKISSIIKILILGEELKGRNNDGQSFIQQKI